MVYRGSYRRPLSWDRGALRRVGVGIAPVICCGVRWLFGVRCEVMQFDSYKTKIHNAPTPVMQAVDDNSRIATERENTFANAIHDLLGFMVDLQYEVDDLKKEITELKGK